MYKPLTCARQIYVCTTGKHTFTVTIVSFSSILLFPNIATVTVLLLWWAGTRIRRASMARLHTNTGLLGGNLNLVAHFRLRIDE